MDFLGIVQDQVVNLAPPGGEWYLAPRLEGWVAACDIYCVPQGRRAQLIEMARILFEATNDRTNVQGLHRMPIHELTEPTLDEIDG